MMVTTAVSYFKRYKMEVDLRDLPPLVLPTDFQLLPWSDDVVGRPCGGSCTTASIRKLTP